MEYLDCSKTISLLSFTADKVIEKKQYLCELDSFIGDGDHGIGMSKGMESAKKRINVLTDCENVFEIFSEFGKTMMMTMGGASGIVFGSMFSSGAKEMEKSALLSPSGFTLMMEKSLISIMDRGKAVVGDKTMIDALAPAVQAMKESNAIDFKDLFSVASVAAKEGAENTINLQAKIGRAKSLLERSIGHKDAGATSTYIIFSAMKEFCEIN